MSHVCGLFARRAFNVEGILCLPVEDGTRSAVLLVVADDERLEQVVRQLRKLEDVARDSPRPGGARGIRRGAIVVEVREGSRESTVESRE